MQNISLNQSPQLAQHLSRELTQKLAVLQTPTMQLQTLVHQQMEENPTLEMVEGLQTELGLDEAGLNEESDAIKEEAVLHQAQLTEDWQSLPRSSGNSDGDAEGRHQFLMESMTRAPAMTEVVTNQLNSMKLDDEEKSDVLRLLGHLNENGWLAIPLDKIAEFENRPVGEMEFAQEVLLSLDPPGLGASDLRQCLLVQLLREKKQKTLEYHMIKDCFDSLAKRRFEEIADKLDVEVDDVEDAAERIKSLNPRPGRAFDEDRGAGIAVRTELSIQPTDDGWTVVMERELSPSLRISSAYRAMLSCGDAAVSTYLRDQIRRGRFFISCLEQRQETIRKVAEQIVARQRPFFDEGPSHLRPMTMTDIAQAIGVHETTISRAVAGKYARTPHGVFELRSFFTSGMATDRGEAVSQRTVEAALRDIIAREDGGNPYTDEQLAGELALAGIRISRRTVMKYRDRLGILPAALRRSRTKRCA